ncbi:hypothetical protein IP88_12395 [alpha proteobacterium AAP81b]|nr:hypothetical protein IP88_12395 [alpha proteobacterium AAP81b]
MTIPTGLELTVFDETFRERPHERFAALRSACPVHHDAQMNRYLLTREAEVAAVLRDRSMSVQRENAAPGSFAHQLNQMLDLDEREPSLLFLDDPRHKRLRGLVASAFTPRAVEAARPEIARVADELLDGLSGEVDLIDAYASPLPIIVIAAMLGVDPADAPEFRAWALGLSNVFSPIRTPELTERLARVTDAIERYFFRVVAERRAAPRDDLLTALVRAEVEGDRLNDREIVTMATLLLLAGNLTTTDLIGNAVYQLLSNPDQLALLRAEPGLAGEAVEETLRRDPPVVQTMRMPMAELTLDGVTAPKGATVVPFLMAAGLDPDVHADPHRFDITRADKRHHAFGGGAHFCLGAPLARAEATIALERLFARLPGLRLADRPIERNLSAAFNGFKELWVVAN